MPSHDRRWIIERYPNYEKGKLENVSYGCPDLGLMGYGNITDLLKAINHKLVEEEKDVPTGKVKDSNKEERCVKCGTLPYGGNFACNECKKYRERNLPDYERCGYCKKPFDREHWIKTENCIHCKKFLDSPPHVLVYDEKQAYEKGEAEDYR